MVMPPKKKIPSREDLAERRQVTAIRLRPSVKAALEKAAIADRRSASSYIEGLIVDDLKAKGFLK
jgi:hypothetical protein